MERRLKTYNCDEKAYLKAIRKARREERFLAILIEGFIYAYGEGAISDNELNDYLSFVTIKKKKIK